MKTVQVVECVKDLDRTAVNLAIVAIVEALYPSNKGKHDINHEWSPDTVEDIAGVVDSLLQGIRK